MRSDTALASRSDWDTPRVSVATAVAAASTGIADGASRCVTVVVTDTSLAPVVDGTSGCKVALDASPTAPVTDARPALPSTPRTDPSGRARGDTAPVPSLRCKGGVTLPLMDSASTGDAGAGLNVRSVESAGVARGNGGDSESGGSGDCTRHTRTAPQGRVKGVSPCHRHAITVGAITLPRMKETWQVPTPQTHMRVHDDGWSSVVACRCNHCVLRLHYTHRSHTHQSHHHHCRSRTNPTTA